MGGNLMNFINLFWMFGHPEVYILILPAFGVMSEISSTYSGKRLYGYTSIVAATMCIAVLSFTVWLHHFFTMGQSATVNAAFGVATLLIAIPTGVKIYDWLATLWGGRIRFTAPMIYLCGFFVLFTIGGLSGVILASPTDYDKIESSIRKLDVVPRQVLIEVLIAEVTLTDDLEYGIDWFINARSGMSMGGSGVLEPNVTRGTLNLGGLPPTPTGAVPAFAGLQLINSLGGDVRGVLNALGTDSRLRIVSSPSRWV
jgi:hypothetical protein